MATADWSKKTSDASEDLRRQWRADRGTDASDALTGTAGAVSSGAAEVLASDRHNSGRALWPSPLAATCRSRNVSRSRC